MKSKVCKRCGDKQAEPGHEPFCGECHARITANIVRDGIDSTQSIHQSKQLKSSLIRTD